MENKFVSRLNSNRKNLGLAICISATLLTSVAVFAHGSNTKTLSSYEKEESKRDKYEDDINRIFDFSEYSAYGDFSYDRDNKVYTFNDKPIRFFYDLKSKLDIRINSGYTMVLLSENSNDYAIQNGVMIRILRDSNGDIEDCLQMTEEETQDFIADTKFLNGMELTSKSKPNSSSTNTKVAEDSKVDDKFSLYAPYGNFEYNKDNEVWHFNDEPIALFLDMDNKPKRESSDKYMTLSVNKGSGDGILVKVNRDSSGKIKDITTMSRDEAYKFLTSNNKYKGLEWVFE